MFIPLKSILNFKRYDLAQSLVEYSVGLEPLLKTSALIFSND